MLQPNQPPNRLVQIEPLRKPSPSSSPSPTIPAASSAEIEFPTPPDWWVYQQKIITAVRKILGFLYTKHSYGAARRWVLATFLPDRILYRWKPYQRGGCNRCGLCCKIVFRCPFFVENEQTTACMIFSTRHAVPPCVTFPLDPIDLREVQREVAPAPCPFYFEGEPEHPTTWGAVKAEMRAALARRMKQLKEAFDS